MAGFLLCDLYLGGQVKTDRRSYLWDLWFAGSLGLAVCVSHFSLPYTLLPWLALVLCVSAFRGKIAHWLLGRPLLTTIGGMCYTIYMYHWLMISGLIRGTIKFSTHIFWLDLLIQFAVMSVVIIGICSVLFVLFERPFMKRDWPQKFWNWVTRKTASS
jgi:peptidoglycan/LPS O-acetylase OafA/YrhL